MSKESQDGKPVEIGIIDALRDIARAKATLAIAMMIAVVLAASSTIFQHKTYKAEAYLVPSRNGAHVGTNSTFPELKNIGMLSVGFSPVDGASFTKYTKILNSAQLANVLFQNISLRPILFPDCWDADRKVWKQPAGMLAFAAASIDRLIGNPVATQPQPVMVKDYLDENLVILNDRVLKSLSLSIHADSPADAVYLLRTIILAADNLVRQSVVQQAAMRTVYLGGLLHNISMQEQRDAIVHTMADQKRLIIMASADKIYSINMLEPPAAIVVPDSPGFLEFFIRNIFIAVTLVTVWAVSHGYWSAHGSAVKPSEIGLDATIHTWIRKCLAIVFRSTYK